MYIYCSFKDPYGMTNGTHCKIIVNLLAFEPGTPLSMT